MSVLQNINGSLYRMDASDLVQLAAVDTEGILGGTPGAVTNGQTLVDQLAADDVQAQTDIGQIKTDLSNYHVVPSRNKLENKAVGTTKDNIVFTVAADGIIKGNGTAASPAVQYATLSITGGVVPNVWKGMKLSGCVNGSSSTHNYNVAYFNTQTGTQAYNDIVYTDGYTIKDYDYINIFARVVAGAHVTNATWEPMIETAEDYAANPTYEPYFLPMRDGKLDITDEQVLGAWNLLTSFAQTQTITSGGNSLTVTANPDGSVTINGDCATSYYYKVCNINESYELPKELLYLSGTHYGDGVDKCYIYAKRRNAGNTEYEQSYSDRGSGVLIDIPSGRKWEVFIAIIAGNTFNNYTLYPMLTVKPCYTPYVKRVLTNAELTAGIVKQKTFNYSYTASTTSKNTQAVTVSDINIPLSRILAAWCFVGSTNDRCTCNYISDNTNTATILVTNEMGHSQATPLSGVLHILYI